MADIPKLAGTFDALRVTVEVTPDKMEKALDCYEKAGLRPDLGKFDKQKKVLLIRVSVPIDIRQCPIGSVPRAFSRLTDTFGGEIRDATKTPLICPIRHLIDCSKAPFVPEGWIGVISHKKIGLFEWDPAKVELRLSCSQKAGKDMEGHVLFGELSRKEILLNANVLDYLLDNQELILDDWDSSIFFWGTTYSRIDGNQPVLCVRCMYKRNGSWNSGFRQLNSDFNSYHAAICLKA